MRRALALALVLQPAGRAVARHRTAPRFARAVRLRGGQGAEPSLAINTFPGTRGFGGE